MSSFELLQPPSIQRPFIAALSDSQPKESLQNLWSIRVARAVTVTDMDQITLGLDPLPKKTRKEVFLDEMNQVVPWAALVALIQPHARGAHQAWAGARRLRLRRCYASTACSCGGT